MLEGNRIHRKFMGTMAALVALALQPMAIGQDATGRLLDQMQARRLDGLLEEFCARNLRRDNLAEFDRARFASSLAGSLTDRAMEANDEKQREAAWDGALRVLTQALNDTQSPTGKISLGHQIAVLELVRGEWWRQHGELHPEQHEARSRAKRQLASAIGRLKELDQTLFPIIQRGKQMKRPTPSSRQALELEPLANAITYRLGLAELTLARCLDEDDPNRKELLRSAIGHLEPTARSSNHASAFQASIDSQLASRLMGDYPAANAILDRWMNEKPSPDEADLLVAERIDWLLDQQKSKDALDLLETTLKSRSNPPPRWSYLYIKALLQLASAEKDAGRVSELHAHAFRQLRALESMGDTPWLLRGEILLREQASNLSSEDTANVRRAAEILAKSGEYAQAADLFRDAAAKAEKSERADEVVALLAESGRVLESAGKHADAAAIFIDLAARQPDHPRAPAYLLRAIKSLWRGDAEEGGNKNRDKIERLLADHRERYPNDASAPEARYLLATVRQSERRYAEAIEQFTSVPHGHRLWADAQLRASRCYEAWLAPLSDELGTEAGLDAYRQAMAFHESLLGPGDGKVEPAKEAADSLNEELKQELSIRLARFLLDTRADRGMEAKSLLEQVIASGKLSHDTLVQAQRYLLFAAASQGDGNAQRMIDALAPMTAEDLLATLSLLETAAEFSTPSKQRYIGELEDRLLADFAQRGEITPSSQRAFEIVRAAIDLNVGTPDRVDDSIRRLRKLRQDQPHDARTTMTLGRAYLQARRYESAIETFRQLIADQKTGSPNWYRGKLYLTRGLRLSGQTEQAKRILDQLEILRPDLGGPKLRQAFLQEKRILDARSP